MQTLDEIILANADDATAAAAANAAYRDVPLDILEPELNKHGLLRRIEADSTNTAFPEPLRNGMADLLVWIRSTRAKTLGMTDPVVATRVVTGLATLVQVGRWSTEEAEVILGPARAFGVVTVEQVAARRLALTRAAAAATLRQQVTGLAATFVNDVLNPAEAGNGDLPTLADFKAAVAAA